MIKLQPLNQMERQIAMGRVQTADAEVILPNRPTKGGETGIDSNSHITGFSPAIFKKWEKNLADIFPTRPRKRW